MNPLRSPPQGHCFVGRRTKPGRPDPTHCQGDDETNSSVSSELVPSFVECFRKRREDAAEVVIVLHGHAAGVTVLRSLASEVIYAVTRLRL